MQETVLNAILAKNNPYPHQLYIQSIKLKFDPIFQEFRVFYRNTPFTDTVHFPINKMIAIYYIYYYIDKSLHRKSSVKCISAILRQSWSK